MEFCPECGTRMVSSRKKDGERVTVEIVCPKCGHKKAAKNSAEDAAKTIKRSRKESITVIAKEHQIRTLPTTQKECPKCGNNLAYVWQVQTRGGDEGSTLFFRCTKCNYTFREYT
jgi:DNA-directed RNA polymerase subunit M